MYALSQWGVLLKSIRQKKRHKSFTNPASLVDNYKYYQIKIIPQLGIVFVVVALFRPCGGVGGG